MQALVSLVNGALSFAISLTVVLTLADDADETWDRADLVLVAGISAALSGFCTSYFGDNLRRARRK